MDVLSYVVSKFASLIGWLSCSVAVDTLELMCNSMRLQMVSFLNMLDNYSWVNTSCDSKIEKKLVV